MTVKYLDLATGATDGAVLSGNPGSAGSTGATGVITSSGTLVYDNTFTNASVVGQTWAMKVNASTTNGATYFYETITATTSLASEAYYQFSELSSAATALLFAGVGATRSYQLNTTTAGKLQLLNSATTAVWTSTASIPLNSLVRFELYATSGAGTGTLRVAFYNGQSTTAIEDSGTLTAQQVGASGFSQVRWGKASSGTYGTAYWALGMGRNDGAAGFMGPMPITALVTTGTATVDLALSATTRAVLTTAGTATVNVQATASASAPVTTTGTATVNVQATATAYPLEQTDGNAGIGVLLEAEANSFVLPKLLAPFTITLYDKAFQRLQTLGDPVTATFQPRWPGVGTGEVQVRATDPANEWLQTPGCRYVVEYRGQVLSSGWIDSYHGTMLPGGTIIYQTVDDYTAVRETLAWVAPSADLSATSTTDPAQAVYAAGSTHADGAADGAGYYAWGSPASAETAIKQIIADNFTRLGRTVTIQPDLGRGGDAAAAGVLPAVRFNPLNEIVEKIADWADLRILLWQQPGESGLRLDVAPNRTMPQALTYDSGVLVTADFSVNTPAATRAIIGGPGQDVAREFYEVDDATGLEATYGRQIEVFHDSTSGAQVQWPDTVPDALRVEKYYAVRPEVSTAQAAGFLNALAAAGANVLAQAGPTSGVDVKLSETDSFHYGGSDGFQAGDLVTISSNGLTFTERITECTLTWSVDGFTVTPTLGTQSNDPDVVLYRALQSLAQRLRNTSTGR